MNNYLLEVKKTFSQALEQAAARSTAARWHRLMSSVIEGEYTDSVHWYVRVPDPETGYMIGLRSAAYSATRFNAVALIAWWTGDGLTVRDATAVFTWDELVNRLISLTTRRRFEVFERNDGIEQRGHEQIMSKVLAVPKPFPWITYRLHRPVSVASGVWVLVEGKQFCRISKHGTEFRMNLPMAVRNLDNLATFVQFLKQLEIALAA